ncbi:type IV secretory system conjugative DNA transfer family protein (plasmid) [Agrobacterium leguminum]|uniref:type IV secretory system conjugative DNA transfer family protein n=1 Tax=Agrobacterium leguminum TaxID=2792015 RepID=UPI0010C9D0CA|nr:type IV secretory system conjugative DNA transfer family protein [Agrobacterium leguminum]WFS69614.1 type IV secretory system conjugative DNA transfer family protein [Agrobacterium leguminum]
MERTKAIIRVIILAPVAALLGVLVGGMLGVVGSGIEAALGLGTDAIGRIMQLVGAVLGAIGGVFIVIRRYFPKGTVSDVFGTARWAQAKDTKPLTESHDGLLIGRDLRKPDLFRYDGAAHLITLAPTRTGKGVGAIIPNLLTADRSVICIDPKGENARVTGRRREAIGKAFYLDPFGVSGKPGSAYNPLDALDPAAVDLAEDAATIADALVFDPPGQVSDNHWNEESKALITGMILYAVCHEEPENRTLATVRDYLTLAPDQFKGLLTLMQQSREARGLIARAANRQIGKSEREGAGVLSNAQRHTHFLDSPRIHDVTARSDFRFADLKTDKATVFLILPPDRLDTYARWLRLLLAQALTDMARSPAKPEKPVLFMLDEFAALGRLDPVERAMGLMAGYGLQLWPILQDIHQLRALYGEKAGTFFSNAGVIQTFGVNDYETAEWISKTLGQATIEFSTHQHGKSTSGPLATTRTQGVSQQLTGRALLTPDEVMHNPENEQILMVKDMPPVAARKLRYFEDKEFSGLYDQP